MTVMKHSISTLLILLFFVAVSSHSQTKDKNITVTFTDITLSEAIRKIEGISIYTFFYDATLIDMNQKVSLKANKLPVNQAVKQLLQNSTLQFEISNTQIALIQSEVIKSTPKKITGIVTDEKGEPLIGATIKLKDTNIGTTTSLLGDFSLENSTNASVLVVSYIGYTTNEYRITNKSDLKIILREDAKSLSEVVVIGYGESSKRDLTGSIVKITGSSIANRPNSNAVSSLQGKVPGLSIVNTGQMNQAPDVRIRGTVSLSKTSPLYVVDGIMSDNMDMVNTSEIESMEVLKDPSSLAIFGVRGANGVIIVTTKKGKSGRLIINANSSVGLKSIADAPRMTDRDGFITLYNEQRFNNSLPLYKKYELYSANTNWIDVIKEPSPTVYKANVSVSHGTDKNKFYMGINVNKEKGLIQFEDFQKIGISVSDELNPVSFLKIGFGLNGYAASLPQYHDFTTALKSPPIVEPYNLTEAAYNSLPEGLGSNDIENPLLTVEGKKNTSVATEYAFVPNFFVELKLLEKFTFRTNYYFNLYTKQQRDYTPLSQIYNLETAVLEVKNDKTSVNQFSNLDLRFQQEYLLTYRNAFQNHNLTVLAGVTSDYQYYTQTSASVKQKNTGADNAIPNDPRWWYVGVFPYGDPTSYWAGSDQYEKKTLSFLFRTLYNFDGKYMVNASFRRDGSTAISPSHRYQNFWALGGAWVLTEEKFMKEMDVFDNLKLKASVGQLGNQYTGSGYRYLYYPVYTNSTQAVFGDNVVNALSLSYQPDKNLRWETVTSYEGGIESDFLNSKLHAEVNYYLRKTDDLLTTITDRTTGILYAMNAGSIRVSGLEFQAAYSDNTLAGQLEYSFSANLSTMNNKVLSVWKQGESYIGGSVGQSRTEAGYPISRFYGYDVEGVYQTKAEITSGPDVSALGTPQPGDLKFRDISGPDGNPDGKVDSYDQTTIGNPTPKLTYGFSWDMKYKGFDMAIEFQGVYGNQVWRAWGNEGNGVNTYNFREARLGRWTGLNTSNWEPRQSTTSGWNSINSSYFIEDGSYLRIRNIELGYVVAPALVQQLAIDKMRLFISVQNLKTWKKTSGFTPEAGGSALSSGIDYGGYPIPTVFAAGFNLTF
jgi:TonB-linked SusC/RagA family outer membrane protein